MRDLVFVERIKKTPELVQILILSSQTLRTKRIQNDEPFVEIHLLIDAMKVHSNNCGWFFQASMKLSPFHEALSRFSGRISEPSNDSFYFLTPDRSAHQNPFFEHLLEWFRKEYPSEHFSF